MINLPAALLRFLDERERLELDQLNVQAEGHRCAHPTKQVRRRVLSNGSIQIGEQCLVCGRLVGGAIKQHTAAAVVAWDDGLMRRYDERPSPFVERRRLFWIAYGRYLASPDWQAKRQPVIERCGNVCEGCRNARVDQVHHLSYEHVGDELVFELVGLCERCHDIAHGREPRPDDDYDGEYDDVYIDV